MLYEKNIKIKRINIMSCAWVLHCTAQAYQYKFDSFFFTDKGVCPNQFFLKQNIFI